VDTALTRARYAARPLPGQGEGIEKSRPGVVPGSPLPIPALPQCGVRVDLTE
jgi:hypothetical protein